MTELAARFEPAASATASTSVRETSSPKKTSTAGRRRKRHLGLWLGLGIPGGLVTLAAAAAAVLLIAPGVSAAGANIGWRTADLAAAEIQSHLANTHITIENGATSVTLTGAELGVKIDADAAAAAAYDTKPLWNVTEWNSGAVPAPLSIDTETALASLRAADPAVFTAPVNAGIEFDPEAVSYIVVDALLGTGLDFSTLSVVISDQLRTGADAITVSAQLSDVEPPITTADAQYEAASLNTLISTAGFSIDGETVVSPDPATVASWLSVQSDDDSFQVSADDAAIDEFVQTLPKKVDREVVNEEVVTNSAGDHLRTIQEGQDGWTLSSTDGIAPAYAEQLEAGSGVFELAVDTVPATVTELFRTIEVDKSAGRTTLYENDKVVATYSVAIGKPNTPTDVGHFTVYGQLTKQDMGCVPGFDYCTKDVPWVTYFNGDQGFHGTYWHSNFGAGAMMSHGCVNMTIAAAKAVYYFAQTGTEVWVHA